MTKPHGVPTVSPYLVVPDADRAITFMEQVLGGRLVRRFEHEAGGVLHAEVRIDDSVVMLGDAGDGWPARPAQVHVYVDDVDACYREALRFGATSVQEPTRQEGDEDRRGGVDDGAGTTWWIASHEGRPS